MITVNRVTGALAFGTALLLVVGLVVGLTFPSRVAAQTAGQGQAIGILLLLGLSPRSGAQRPAEAKKPEGAAKKAAHAQTPGKTVRRTADPPTSGPVKEHPAVRSVAAIDAPRAKD